MVKHVKSLCHLLSFTPLRSRLIIALEALILSFYVSMLIMAFTPICLYGLTNEHKTGSLFFYFYTSMLVLVSFYASMGFMFL